MILNGLLEGEVDGVVGVLNVAQQISSGLHGRNFDSLLDESFFLIRQVYIFVLVLLWCSAVCGLGMKRTVVVEDVTIFASGADGKDNRNAEIAET